MPKRLVHLLQSFPSVTCLIASDCRFIQSYNCSVPVARSVIKFEDLSHFPRIMEITRCRNEVE